MLLDHEANGQRARMRGERREMRFTGEPCEILFGGEQHQVRGFRASQERLRLCRRVAMMVGEARAFRDLDPRIGERREEFFRMAYAGEGEKILLVPSAASALRSGSRRPWKTLTL